MLGRRTNETGSGCLLPTPLTVAVSTNQAERTYQRDMQRVGNATWQAVLAVAERKWPARVPTPGAQDGSGGGAAINNLKGQIHLRDWVKTWPTPTVQDAHNNGGPSQMERNSLPLNAQVGGALNPTWVEWLMGWPLGWTALKPSETAKCHSVPQPHSECLEAEA